jgi:hypothetical protein
VVSPIELMRTRMQAEQALRRQGMVGGAVALVRREGYGALWKGLYPTLWRDVPFSCLCARNLPNSTPARRPSTPGFERPVTQVHPPTHPLSRRLVLLRSVQKACAPREQPRRFFLQRWRARARRFLLVRCHRWGDRRPTDHALRRAEDAPAGRAWGFPAACLRPSCLWRERCPAAEHLCLVEGDRRNRGRWRAVLGPGTARREGGALVRDHDRLLRVWQGVFRSPPS